MEEIKLTNQIEKRLRERGHTDPKKVTSVIMDREARMLAKGNIPPGFVDGDAFVPDDIHEGDYVDFGAYGRLFVLKAPMAGSLWVTDKRADRYNYDAAGWYIRREFAKKIIEEA